MPSNHIDTVYGSLPGGLKCAPLENLCEKDGVQTGPFGSQLHKEDYVSDGTPIITVEHLADNRIAHSNLPRVSEADRERLAKYSLRTGDIVFSRVGSVDRRALVQQYEDGWLFSGRCLRVRPKAGVLDSAWLSYFFGLPAFKTYIRGIAVGATMPSINTKILSEVPIYYPPIDIQVRSAEFLTALDNRINLLHQTNTTLESIAQALFKSWFIDFDPVRAKAEGREPEGMEAAKAALFPAELEESALGLIPKGWQVEAIKNVVENVYDGPHATPSEASVGPVFLGIKNLSGTSIDLTEVRHISEDDWAQWTRRVTPQPGDIVFSYEAALGLFALVPPGLRCCLGRRLALVRPKPEAGTPHFWFHQFVGAPFQRLLEKHTVHGATVNRIALKEFPSFTVMDPGERIRTAFEVVAQPLWARIHANRQQALHLGEVRDAILPRIISGKLRLPEVQSQLEEAIA
ncbi:MAG TPA: restriction endonuclease subunit S [Lysobacter sp.]